MYATGSVSEEEKKISAAAERFCRRFSVAEIQLATADFSDEYVIGQGGFGKVYKGVIDDDRQTVAIKRLAPNSNQGKDEFSMEIETLSKLRHVNLVSLIGYCNEREEMILVYEYIVHGTLADHIYEPVLTWKQRLDICIGAARGLDYLHTGSSIIHRDVKSTNILLDENFVARVSDFGLAKHFSNSKSHVTTLVKGSFGYLDPSYFTTGRLTRNSDTYAFGVVLLEVLCGRAAVDSRRGEDEVSLAMWAQEKITKGKVEQIVASSLRYEISADCLKTFVGVAKRCLNREPKKRPTMAQVVAQLEMALEQQTATHNASRFLSLNAFWNTVKPSVKKRQEYFLQNGGFKLTQWHSSSDPVRIFSESELQKATNNFDRNMIVGEGGYGIVYKGILQDDKLIAIKKSREVAKKETEQFVNEVLVLSQINHRNVVKLLGCCLETQVPLLVYEFISNGTLYEHIHNRAKARCLSWDMRLRIATETAGVLSYLHSSASTPIIHRDVKSTNILLNHTFTAKVSDLEASKLVLVDESGTLVQGTVGYLDPEYMQTRQLTEKSDVYSFGVVLVELLTGRKALSYDMPEDERCLANFFLQVMKEEDSLFRILEYNVVREGDKNVLMKVAVLAKRCLSVRGDERPSMKEVAMELEGLRAGGKHSWTVTEHIEEDKESLLGKNFTSFTDGEGTT